jgi:hypothetical protein
MDRQARIQPAHMKMYACSYEETPHTVSRRKVEQQRGERGRFVSHETVEAIHEVTETPRRKPGPGNRSPYRATSS